MMGAYEIIRFCLSSMAYAN